MALKELRETEVWLKVILRAGLIQSAEKVAPLAKETDELIAILFASVDTAGKNRKQPENK